LGNHSLTLGRCGRAAWLFGCRADQPLCHVSVEIGAPIADRGARNFRELRTTTVNAQLRQCGGRDVQVCGRFRRLEIDLGIHALPRDPTFPRNAENARRCKYKFRSLNETYVESML